MRRPAAVAAAVSLLIGGAFGAGGCGDSGIDSHQTPKGSLGSDRDDSSTTRTTETETGTGIDTGSKEPGSSMSP